MIVDLWLGSLRVSQPKLAVPTMLNRRLSHNMEVMRINMLIKWLNLSFLIPLNF
jgi:hypothetical protein